MSVQCEKCWEEFPRNELKTRSWTVGNTYVGGTTRTSTSTLSSGTTRRTQGNTSGRTITQRKVGLICSPCWADEKARLTRVFLTNLLVFSVVALAIIGFLFLRPHNANNPTQAVTSVDSPAIIAPPKGDVAPPSLDSVPEMPQSTSPRTSTTDERNMPSEISKDSPSTTVATPQTNDALRRAIEATLETGQARNWKGSGSSGGVSVSAEQEEGGKICKNFRFTITGGGSETPIDGTACKSDGRGWEIAK